MSNEKRVHAGAVESLFLRALENRLTPACHRLLSEAGLDLERKLAPTYSIEQWKQFLRIAAGHLYAGMPAEAAYYSLGERCVEGYFSTLFGRTLLGLVRLAGPRHALLGIRYAFRTSTSFLQVRVTQQDTTAMELWVNEVLADQPTFIAGVLARTVEYAGGHQTVVTPEQFDGESCTFRVHWYEPEQASMRQRRLLRRRLATSSQMLPPAPPV